MKIGRGSHPRFYESVGCDEQIRRDKGRQEEQARLVSNLGGKGRKRSFVK